ncbi:MAG: PIN domain-containing protein [Verrucomicrobiota bacterium]
MKSLYLDTHIILWIYAGELKKIPPEAVRAIEQSSCKISPMVLLELNFLYEIGRTLVPHETIIPTLKNDIDLEICQHSFEAVSQKASLLNWTRDPFDRIIVAQASLHHNPLMTADRLIQKNYSHTIWK